MNRTAKCLEMINHLKGGRLLSKAELARRLKTNPRNIREYKDELKAAGYAFEEKPGRKGGIRLKADLLLPQTRLDQSQLDAIYKGLDLVHGHGEFVQVAEFDQGMGKLLSMVQQEDNPEGAAGRAETASEKGLYDVLEKACREQEKVYLSYRKRGANEPERVLVHPYEVVHREGAYYLLAWSEPREDWRRYRISSQRLMEARPAGQFFQRRTDFQLEDWVGEVSIYADGQTRYTVRVKKDMVHVFLESDWGKRLKQVGEDSQWTVWQFSQGDSFHVMNLLFRLGDAVQLVQPLYRRKEYCQMLHAILDVYGEGKP